MGIKIQSTALMLLLMISFFGLANGEDATDGTKSEQSSRGEVYDITDEITAAFEATPTTMPAGSTGTVLNSIPVIDGGYTWYEIRYADGTKGWSADIGLKTEISSGDEVKTTINLNVRDAAGTEANSIKVMPAGSTGTILDNNPVIDANGRTWWEVQYKNEDGTTTTGWSADVGLQPEISSGDEVTTTRGVNVRNAPDGVSIPSPSSLNTYDSGIISYGKHQFTLVSGSLYKVLDSYTKLSQTDTSNTISAVDPVSGKSYLSRVKAGDGTLKNDPIFLELLKKAASEPEMVQSQDDVFAQMYYDSAKQKVKTDGLTSALAIVIYTDTNVQGGLNTVSARTAERFVGKEMGKDYTEQDWLRAFLDERKTYLDEDCVASHPEYAEFYKSAASSQGRVGILLNLVNTGNLDLKHGDEGDDFDQIALGNKGKVYAIDAPLRLEKAVDTQSSGDATLAAQMLMLGIGFPQLSSSDSGISWFSDQDKEGSAVQETSGTLFTDKASDVWYVDALSWSGDRNLLPKPAAPLHFASGKLNTYGYGWISRPYSETGITYTPGYADWVGETLASMGITIGAGVGPLDDSQVGSGLGGGGGW